MYNSIRMEINTYKRSYVYMDKKKLTLSIDKKLVNYIKHIALDEDLTVSEIFEDYIRAIKKNRNTIKAIKDINK